MQKPDTFRVNWYIKRLHKYSSELDETFVRRLYEHPQPDFTVEELYALRELLLSVHVSVEGVVKEFDALKDEINVKPVWKRLLRR